MRGKIVWVTGSSAGVGWHVARQCAERGARVAICARRQQPLQRALKTLHEMGAEAIALVGDVADPEQCRSMHNQVVTQLGPIDVLVNNAGAHFRGPFLSHSGELHQEMIAVNLQAPIVLSSLVLPEMIGRGEGAIVNVASLAGYLPLPGSATYSGSKFGLRAWSLALAEELRGSGVTLSVVSPGPIATRFILDNLHEVTDLTLSQPICTPEQVADDVIACIEDGRAERARPRMSSWLATFAYLVPKAARRLRPLLAARGARQRRRLQRAASESGDTDKSPQI